MNKFIFGLATLVFVVGTGISTVRAALPTTVLTFGSDGNETFLIDKKKGKDVTGDIVKINKAKNWSNPIAGTSWISFKPKTNQAGKGPISGKVVSFLETVNVDGVPLSGQISVMVDDNVRILVNDKEVFKNVGKTAIVKTPQVINLTAGQLGRGNNIFEFEVKQNDRADNQPYGLNYKVSISYNSFADLNIQAQGFNVQRQDGLARIKNAINNNAADHGGVFTCATGPLPSSPTFMKSPGGSGVGYDIAPCLVPKYIPLLPFDPEAPEAFWTNAGSYNTYFTISQASGGAITLQAVFRSPIISQTFTIPTAPTLTISAGSNTPLAKSVFMGSIANDLFVVRISADKGDDVRITDLTFTDIITNNSSNIPSFQNMTLWNGATKVAGPVNLVIGTSSTNGQATLYLSQPVVVQKNGSVELTLRGDVASVASGSAVSGSSHVFKVSANSDVTAYSVGNSALTVTVTGAPASGNAMTVRSSKLTVSATALGNTSGRGRTIADNIGNIFFGSNGSQLTLNTVTLTFVGSAIVNSSGTPASAFSVSLLDPSNVPLGSSSAQTCTPSASTKSCVVTFNPSYTISPSSSIQTTVRVNSAQFLDSTTTNDTFTALINGAGDVTYSDGSASGITLDSQIVPIVVFQGVYQ